MCSWLQRAGDAFFGPVNPGEVRRSVVQRPVVAGMLLLLLMVPAFRIPGWPVVVVACSAAIAYNFPLAYLVIVEHRFVLARGLIFLLDTVLLLAASLLVMREMGAVGSTSSIWLIFIVYVVTGGFTLAPLGSLVYTALWMAWFALGTLLYFSPESVYYRELPVRLAFMAVIGLISLSMARELQQRRQELEQQHRRTLGMLARLVEARDTDAGAHLQRIQRLSRALALRIGLSKREADEIAYASMIHDVGKANVPDAILRKQGPLSPEEWEIMQHHTMLGDDLLADSVDFALARQVARWHHERWDGSGYPDGLVGEQIPLAARIVAVADVYDALISHRPYKEAWPPDVAIEEIRRLAGSHLDPHLVQAFVALWEEGEIDSLLRDAGEDATAAPPVGREDAAA